MALKNNLGSTQKLLLQALARHGSYRPGCGWHMTSDNRTVRLLAPLVRRELVVQGKAPDGGDHYMLSEVGMRVAASLFLAEAEEWEAAHPGSVAKNGRAEAQRLLDTLSAIA